MCVHVAVLLIIFQYKFSNFSGFGMLFSILQKAPYIILYVINLLIFRYSKFFYSVKIATWDLIFIILLAIIIIANIASRYTDFPGFKFLTLSLLDIMH